MIICLAIVALDLKAQEFELDYRGRIEQKEFRKLLKPLYGDWKIYKYGKCEPEWMVCSLEDSCAEFLVGKTLRIKKKYLELLEEVPCFNLGIRYYITKKCEYKWSELEIADMTCEKKFEYQRWQNCTDMDSEPRDEFRKYWVNGCSGSIINHFYFRKRYDDIVIWIHGRALFLKKVEKQKGKKD